MVGMIRKIKSLIRTIGSFNQRLCSIQEALGRIEARQIGKEDGGIEEHEFQVYSQFGEDGIIQWLLQHVEIKNRVFVEFGASNYLESNTRFLLINNNWSGLVIDGDPLNVSSIKADPIYWRHNLKALCSFVTKDNINQLLESNGLSGDIGLLSVDIDGNDYWVWDSINVINPCIVVCEYNSLWGDTLSVSTPYDPAFDRTSAHYSNLYFGASIAAFATLADSKGYSLVGSNLAGNNLFFVRKDLLGSIATPSAKDAWVQSQFREARDESGQLTFLPFEERLKLLAEMPLVNLDDGKQYKVRDLYGAN
jgi:hypothetical protein